MTKDTRIMLWVLGVGVLATSGLCSAVFAFGSTWADNITQTVHDHSDRLPRCEENIEMLKNSHEDLKLVMREGFKDVMRKLDELSKERQ